MTRARALAAAHPDAVAVAFLGAVLCAWFWPLLLGDQMGQSHILWQDWPWRGVRPAGLDAVPQSGEGDAAVLYHPMLALAREQIHAGQLPLWDPYVYAGAPLLGDMQSALAYPLTWLGFVLSAEAAWGWIALLKLLTAGAGAHLLARRLGASPGAGAAAGLVYMLSAPLMLWLQWPLATVFSLLPWLLLATQRLYERPGPGRAAALGAVVGLSLLAGHGESALLSSSAAAVYLGVLALADRPGRARTAGAAGWWLAAHALGAGLAGVALLPFLESYRDSITVAVHGDNAGARLPAPSLVNFLMPQFFGDGSPGSGAQIDYLHTAGYAGVAALLLGGVALWRGRRRPELLALAATAVVALMVAYGVPPVSWFMQAVPPYADGNNLRVLYVPALAAAIAAGLGIDSLVRRPLAVRAALAWTGALAALAALLAAGVWIAGELEGDGAGRAEAAAHFALAAAAGAACLVALGRARLGLALAAALVVLALDLGYLRDRNAVLAPDEAHPPTTPALAFLGERSGRIAPIRPDIFQPAVLPGSTSVLYRLHNVSGYELPQSRRWADFSWFVLGERGLTREIILSSPPPAGPSLLGRRIMNVRWYLTAPDAARPHRALRLAYRGPDAAVWRDPGALPAAWVVPAVRRADYGEALAALRSGRLRSRREALVPAGAPLPRAAGGAGRVARVVHESSQRLRVEVPPGAGGWLVIAKAHARQWEASVDGRPAALHPTNFAATGLPLGPGAHTVELRLRRDSLAWGLALSGAALALTVALALAGRRARRSRSA